MSRLPIARYLFSSHTLFLIMFLGAFYLLVAVVVAVAALATPITLSGVDVAGQALHWLALGYGYSAATLLTTMIVHGRTRREFLVQHPLFQVVTSAVLAALITGVYALEAVVYRAAGWTRRLQDHRIFEATDYPTIFGAYWSMLTVCLMTGAFLGAAILRWETAGALALLPAAVVVVYAGAANGLFSLPFARVGLDVAVTAVMVAAGWALLWSAVRDMPVRIRVPA
ncbi:hypothetical protein [Actinoplanes utahensis]|uniref:Uncharacterized protein n=1 Tax=Actinoplanes utahensis TaxID=1869 RepID=A0A0A6X0H7_ACTUT|nr:hypothetical protein [Actinoplanes utahensis]KHD73522.1 hypothetical protein MB27_33775 [Actinoplanes utahensis]GIF33835.1 hypothetical protein Aut01nite_68210 [Actinoplanes utahensis]